MIAIAGGTGKNEMGNYRDDKGKKNENEPRQANRPFVGLVQAHPSKVGSEALQFIVGVGGTSREFYIPSC